MVPKSHSSLTALTVCSRYERSWLVGRAIRLLWSRDVAEFVCCRSRSFNFTIQHFPFAVSFNDVCRHINGITRYDRNTINQFRGAELVWCNCPQSYAVNWYAGLSNCTRRFQFGIDSNAYIHCSSSGNIFWLDTFTNISRPGLCQADTTPHSLDAVGDCYGIYTSV